MKLHLPTRLRAAVLACVTAVAAIATTVGTGALTTGVAAYTLAVSQAYAENYEYTTADNNVAAKLTAPTAEDTITFVKESGYLTQGGGTINAHAVINQLKLTDGYSNVTYTFTNDVTGTGEFTFAATTSANTQNYAFTGNVSGYSGDMTIASNKTGSFSFSNQTGTGTITAQNGTVNLNGATVNNASITAQTVNVSGMTKINADTVMNFTNLNATEDAILSVAEGKALTLNGTVSLYTPVMNSGSVTLGDNIKFDLSHMTADEGVYTLFLFNAVDLSSLTADNLVGTQAGYQYTFGTDGTITAAMVSKNLTWTGGALTWQDGATIGDDTFAQGDIVNFTTANADVTLGGDVTSSQVNIAQGVEVTLGGAHTLTAAEMNINGTLVMDDAVLSSTTLKLAGELKLNTTENIAAGTVIHHEGSASKVTIVGESVMLKDVLNTADNTYKYSGKIVVADGATLKMGGTTSLGDTDNTITVEQGGVLDVNGKPDHEYTFTLNGGSLVNTGGGIGIGSMQIKNLVVTADSEIGGTGQFGVVGRGHGETTVTLNSHTLTKTGTNTFNMVNTTVTAGTLRVEGGVLQQHNSSRINCDIVVAGGNFMGDACSMDGFRTLASEGAGGTIGCNITSAGAVTVDTAAGSTLTMSGALTTTTFSKTGEGTLAMTGALTVSKKLFMNYEGALTLGEVSVADGAVLQYSGGAAVMNLGAAAAQGALVLDIVDVDTAVLTAGLNLGLASGISKDNISVIGMAADSYTLTDKDGYWQLTASAGPVISTDWDAHWGNHELVKAPAEIKTAEITESIGLAAPDSIYDDGTNVAAVLTGEGGAGVMVFGGVNNSETGSSLGPVSRNTWVKATSGTYQLIAGGSYCNNWDADPAINLNGSSHVLVDGATVGFVMGGNYRDGKDAAINGDTYVTVQGNSTVATVIGAGTIAHNGVNTVNGSTHVFVNTPLAAFGDISLGELAKNVVAGGGLYDANTAGTVRITGDTNVTIDLSAYEGTATFAKHVVGASYMTRCTSEVQGDSKLTITASDTVTFNQRVTAGIMTDNSSNDIVVNQKVFGTATAVINGGKYTAYSGAAGYLNSRVDATIGGAHLTVNGGVFTERFAGGVFQNTNKITSVTIGNIVNDLNGGSFSNGNFAFTGGNVVYSINGTACTSVTGDITTNVNGASITGKVYGGSFNASGHTAGTFTHGDIAVNLNSGSLNGDVYAGGTGCKGNATMTAASTTVTIGKAMTLTDGKTISGGYESNTGSTVKGSRTLAFSTDGEQTVTNVNFKDFDVVKVTEADAVVSIKSIVSTTGVTGLSKTGAGTLKLVSDFQSSALTVSEGSLDISSATALGGTLTMGAGSTLVTSTADEAMGVTGLNITSGMTLSVAGAAEGYTNAIKLLSGLTTDVITGLTFVENEGQMVADISGIITVSGVSADYNRLTLSDGTLSLVSTAAPAEKLTWLGGDGTWGGESTPWTGEGGETAYVAGSNVTIGGEGGAEGGDITVSGEQTAKNVTIVESGYSIQRANSGTNSLTIQGALTVADGVSFSSSFLPTVGSIVLNEGSELFFNNAGYVNVGGNLKNILGKISADSTGTLKMTGGTGIADANRLMLGGQNVTISGASVHITNDMAVNTYQGAASLVVNSGLTVDGELRMESLSKLDIQSGAEVSLGTLTLGHAQANNPGHLAMAEDSSLEVGSIQLLDNTTQNTITVNGGTLTIKGKENSESHVMEAFVGTGTATTVNIGSAELTNGTTDMTFNHSSTLTGTTVTATEGTTITVGGESMTTNVVTGITTEGTVVLAGTTAVAADATITDNGTLTIADLSAAAANVTLAGSGTTTITTGTADTLTAGADATLGNVSVKNVTGTGTLTQTAGTALTMADGGTLSGSVTTGNITAAGALSKTGTDTVTTGDITGAGTALTVSGGTLSSGAVTVASAEVATGATLTSSGKLTTTGALTLNGAANADSADIASLILNAGGSLACTNDLKLGSLTLSSAITSAGVTAASLSSETLDVTVSADVLGALAMGSGDSLTIVGLTTQYGNGLTLNGSAEASYDEFGYKYTIASTADGIVITKDDAGIVWTGGADDEWGKEGSWQGGGIPTGDDVSASFTGKGDGTVKVSTDGVTIGQIIVTSHDAAPGEKSEYTFTNGDLTIAEDLKVLDGHVIIGTTVAATDVNIIPSATEGSVSSVTVNGDGALSVSGTLAVEAATEEGIGSLTIQEGGFAGVHSLASSGADVALGGTLAVEEGVIKKLTDESGTKGNLVVGSMVAPTSLTPVVPGKVVILEDSEIDTLQVTNTGELTTKGTLTAETSADVAGKVTAEKDLTTGALTVTSTGAVTVGSAAAPATLDVTTLANEGTVTVYNTMKAETSVENKSTGTLDIKGELQAADATVENSKTLTVGGALTADTLTTNSGATTEAKGGATIGTSLDNHGTTTVTGDLSSADATAPIAISNDATGMGEKLTITGNVTAKSLTTEAGATTDITGTGKTVKLTDSLTNKGTTTIKGALSSADASAMTPGSLSIANTGTLSTGDLTADSLSGNGATTVTGNATLSKLDLGTTGSLTASGTVKVGSVAGTGGSVTADTLDLSGLESAATLANLKADKITLSGFEMLTVTDSISNENGTGAAKVMLTLDDATMSTLSVGDEKVVVATDGSVSGQGITLGNLAAVNNALKAYGIKGSMVTTAAGELVMQVQDNSFVSQIATSENGIAGAEMVDAASAAGLATAGSALGDVYAALDACRTSGDAATGDRIAAAVTGSSIAAMGSALSGDVERQLKAIRNRTTTMGVNQAVINEGMPYVNAWVNAEGDYRKVAADGTMAGYKMTSWGGTVGMDVDFTPSFTCGLAATAMYGDFDAESEDHATGDIDTYYVSAFARYAKHRWTHTFVATAGLAETSLERTIQGHTVKGDSDGMMFGGMYEVGYVFALDEDATTCLQPVLNVSYTHASLSGYDEDGANIALSAGDVEFNKLTVGAGARLQSVIGENIYNRSSLLEARALVKFDAGDRQGETDVTFAGTGLPSHTVKSSETGAIGAEFGVGLTVPVGSEGGNLFMDASAEIRAEYTNVNATVGYRVNF